MLALWSVSSACENSAPARTLESVEPSFAANTAPVDVRLVGDGFLDVPLVKLSSRERAALRSGYRVRLGDVFETDDINVLGTDELGFTVPAELRPNPYDVVLIPPAGDALVLKEGFVVTDGADPGTPDRLWLETERDGSGERIGERTLQLGETLEVFALRRDWRNVVRGEPEVVTFSQEPVLGLLSASVGDHTTFDARLPGVTTLRGRSEELGLTATAKLRVEGDLSSFRLSLEDAPQGEGQAYGNMIEARAGDELTVYAVVRDSAGAFVLDVPASWRVSGAQSAPPSTATSLRVALAARGDTSIEADYLGLVAAPLKVRVAAGRALELAFDPNAAQLRAGERAVQFKVTGVDAFGNATDDLGALRFAIADGSFGDFDTSDATLTPRRAGAGHISVQSSYELAATSGLIEVRAGPLARLSLDPSGLSLSADAAPVQFEVEGYDAFDNIVDDLGTLSWITNGEISAIGQTGELDPITAGTGTITVTSSLGPAATSGTIAITAGELKALNVQPQTWSGKVGDPPQQFSATGSDADGNTTADVGTLSFRAVGSIAAIDADTGVFTPTIAGQGTIEVTSSYGLTGVSQNIVVSPQGATLRVSAIRAPSFFWAGENGARVEVDLSSSDANELVISGLSLSFSTWSGDQSVFFTVVADRNNSDRIPAGATRTLIFYIDVDEDLSTLTSITISASGEAFPVLGAPFLFAGSVATSSRIALTEPTLTLTAPVAPANRVCAGGQVMFGAETSNLFSASYEWRIPGGSYASGSSASNRAPTVIFPTVGNFLYSATATYFGYPNTRFGAPIYVGSAAPLPADTYPTGPIVFSAPAAGQMVALSSLPRSDLIAIDPAIPLRQCNNTAVDASGHTAITLFSDRALIDPSADIDSQTPGIQLPLTAAGLLDAVPLIAPSLRVEGATTLYAEYFDQSSGKVTAAGDSTFLLSGDLQPPAVQWTIPGADCGAACLAPGDWLLFHFSEPLLTSTLNNSRVEVFAGTTCTGTATIVTGSATRLYEPAARVLYVKPGSRSGSYAIRVHLPSTITDSASARNALPVLNRCVVFGALGAATAAAVPQLNTAPPASFSPDGDGDQDTATWKVGADAATSFLRLRITRAGRTVWARLAPVAQAGESTFVWDGSDDSGRIVRDGIYGYAIEAVNRSGTASAAVRGYVEVASAVRMVSVRREL